MPTNDFENDKLLTRFDLRDLGITYVNVTLLRKEANKTFPRRIRLSSHRVAWRASEIYAYLDAKCRERDQ